MTTDQLSSVPDHMIGPAGWYPDPQLGGQRRFWDGDSWTHMTVAGDQLPPPIVGHDPKPNYGSSAAYFPATAQHGSVHSDLGYSNADIARDSMNTHTQVTNNKTRTVKRNRSNRDGMLWHNKFTFISVFFGALAIFLMPMIFGVIGILTGVGAVVTRERHGSLGIKISVLGLIIGCVLAFLSSKFGIHI